MSKYRFLETATMTKLVEVEADTVEEARAILYRTCGTVVPNSESLDDFVWEHEPYEVIE